MIFVGVIFLPYNMHFLFVDNQRCSYIHAYIHAYIYAYMFRDIGTFFWILRRIRATNWKQLEAGPRYSKEERSSYKGVSGVAGSWTWERVYFPNFTNVSHIYVGNSYRHKFSKLYTLYSVFTEKYFPALIFALWNVFFIPRLIYLV